jgi:hypothetical protein
VWSSHKFEQNKTKQNKTNQPILLTEMTRTTNEEEETEETAEPEAEEDQEFEEIKKEKKKKKKKKDSTKKKKEKESKRNVVQEDDEEEQEDRVAVAVAVVAATENKKKKKKKHTKPKKRKSSVTINDDVVEIIDHKEDSMGSSSIPAMTAVEGDSSLSSSSTSSPLTTTTQYRWYVIPAEDAVELHTFWQRRSKHMARYPCTYLWITLVISLILSFVALTVGQFEVSAENGGWQSRGTLIADRQTQLMLALEYNSYLFEGNDEAWIDLTTNVQPGDNGDDDDEEEELEEEEDRRRTTRKLLSLDHVKNMNDGNNVYNIQQQQQQQQTNRQPPFMMTPHLTRRLQEEAQEPSSPLLGCDLSFYEYNVMNYQPRLWPTWQLQATEDVSTTLDSAVIRDLCIAEMNTQSVLEEKGLCYGCPRGCLPPYSLVFYARLMVVGGFSMDCEELADAWTPYQQTTERLWEDCISTLKQTYDANSDELPDNCPFGFLPTLVEGSFDATLQNKYTSTVFATLDEHVDGLYENIDYYDRGSNLIHGAYDTQYESFINAYLDASLGRDMSLALGSAVVVSVAIMIHTRSLLITGVGLLQIILSFPLSYFVYKLVAGLGTLQDDRIGYF